MPARARDRRNTLPRNWPCRARSAIVHAASLARVAVAVAHAHAEHHANPPARLQASNDRLEREVALLREEVRIKDARMERLTVQRRPHDPAIERLAILELRAARGWSLERTAHRMLVTSLVRHPILLAAAPAASRRRELLRWFTASDQETIR